MVVVKGRCAVSKLSTNGHDATVRTLASEPSTGARHRARKALGQHFLTDGRILNRIVAAAELSPDDLAVEIGPGRGSLTRRLVQKAGRVVAVEMDEALAAGLPQLLGNPPNLTTLHGDARTIDLIPVIGPDARFRVVANLPYYAANPIIRRFLESGPRPESMVVMVQQEVAQSMLAQPGKMSILSVATQFYAVPRFVCNVPPRAFRPPPKVTSTVVKLDLRSNHALELDDPQPFFALVRAGFAAPRKQLRNSLSQGLGAPPGQVGRLLEVVAVDGTRRPETLSIEEWGRVYDGWERRAQVDRNRSG